MRVLFVGDVVGPPGVDFLRTALPLVRRAENIDLVIANAENAANGSGMSPRIYRQLRQAGVDLMTMGDHIYKKNELIPLLEADDSICKPANFPPEAPGRAYLVSQLADGTSVAVFSVLGRTYMRSVDCPFKAADRALEMIDARTRCIFVDVHAEATADKYLLLHYLKGRVSAVLGTHTHVATADEHVVPEGTAYISDVGMTGPYHSILGRRIDRVLFTTTTFIPSSYDVATEDVRLAGAVVDVDASSGKAVSIRRFMLDEKGLKALAAPAGND